MSVPVVTLDPAEAATVRLIGTEACYEMLATLATPVIISDRDAVGGSAYDIAAFIGFTGPIRGTLMLSSSSELFRSSYPTADKEPPSLGDLFDWAAEISNQLLGRIKRRFCARGVDFQVSTPTAVRGKSIGGRNPVRDGVCDLTFKVGSEVVSVSLEVSPPKTGKIFNDPAAPIGCSHEGELVLF